MSHFEHVSCAGQSRDEQEHGSHRLWWEGDMRCRSACIELGRRMWGPVRAACNGYAWEGWENRQASCGVHHETGQIKRGRNGWNPLCGQGFNKRVVHKRLQWAVMDCNKRGSAKVVGGVFDDSVVQVGPGREGA